MLLLQQLVSSCTLCLPVSVSMPCESAVFTSSSSFLSFFGALSGFSLPPGHVSWCGQVETDLDGQTEC